jgi:hypothetical protein
MKKEIELTESKELREQFKDRIDVLNKVKGLILLPESNEATTEQVAKYYGVPESTIKDNVQNNYDEFDKDGYSVLVGEALKEYKTKNNLSSRAKQLGIFTKRAILRIGMLLRDSEVAKEVRTQLLNTLEHTTDEAKVLELDKEKELYMNIMFAKDEPSRAIAINEMFVYNERYKAKAKYVDDVVNAPNGITITTIAKEFNFSSAKKLNKILEDLGIQYKDKKGQWHLYSQYSELGYTLPYTWLDKYGNTHHCTNWSELGKKFIYDTLSKNNLIQFV